MSILLLTATQLEQNRITSALTDSVSLSVCGRTWRRGSCHGRDVLLIEGGIGAVNTAHAITRALEAETPELVLQTGIAGAYAGSGLRIGDLAIASEEVFGDLGVVTPEGWRPADEIGIAVTRVGGRELFNRYPAAQTTRVAHLLRAADAVAGLAEVHIGHGPFVTVQACSGTAALGAERERRVPGAVCENMEGAAAAQVCALYGVPFVEVRGISNAVEDRDLSGWDLPLANERAQRAAMYLLKEL